METPSGSIKREALLRRVQETEERHDAEAEQAATEDREGQLRVAEGALREATEAARLATAELRAAAAEARWAAAELRQVWRDLLARRDAPDPT
jgi:hypothetical protein